MIKNKDIQFFYGEFDNEKKKKKRTIFFYLLERRFEPQIFSNFHAHDLNCNWKVRSPRSNQNQL